MSEPYAEQEPPDDGLVIGRQPPHDLLAERQVLGAMMLSEEIIADVFEVMRPADHYHPAHERIHDAIVDMYSRGQRPDAVTVRDEIARTSGGTGRIGGDMVLFEMVSECQVPGNARAYAEIIAEKATLRRLIEVSQRNAQAAYSGEGDVADIVSAAEAAMLDISGHDRNSEYSLIGASVEPALDNIQALQDGDIDAMAKVPTGFADLDDLLSGGFEPGQMIVVAGRPAMGKSVLGVDFLRNTSLNYNHASVLFSLEMSKEEVVVRTIAAEAKVALTKLRGGHLGEQDWGQVAGVMGRLQSAPMFIDDSPTLNMVEIRAKARRLKARHDIRLIVIDYLQLMSSGKKVESRQQEVSEFSRQIKLLAKELGVPIVALSQLNRGPEQRSDKRPQLSDLRESGAIEQDADIVILLHRDDYYNKESMRMGEADLIVAKQRGGPNRDVAVVFQGHYSRFVNMAS